MPNPGQVLDGTVLETRNLPRLQAKLGITASGLVPDTRAIFTIAPLAGGGNLAADLTLFMPQSSAVQDGYLSAADFATFAAGIGITQLTGDVTAGPGTGSQAATIAADAVTNAKLADMPATTIKGNNTGGAANPVDLTATQATAMLNPFTSLLQGLVPASGGGTTNFLRADGSWTTAPDTGITQLTGDVTAGPGSGSQIATIAADAVTNAKLADMPANTLKGNNTAGAINPLDLTAAQVVTLLNAVVATRSISTTAPLTGGGDLSTDRTFAISAATTSTAGSQSAVDFTQERNAIAMHRGGMYMS